MNADATLRAQLTARLSAFPVHATFGTDHPAAAHAAAVALTVIDEGTGADVRGIAVPPHWSDQAALLLTRRAAHLKRHPGQWALPGGRIEAGESAEQAALRELHEEVGLPPDAAQVLGRLDDYVTRSGFVITPVVVWVGSVRDLRPDPNEVASIHRIPLTELQRPDAPLLDASEHSPHPVLRMPIGHSWIAAPTAAFLYQFREVCLAGRTTRVAHFDQPMFA
jgi:mutator protein MutT